MSSFDESRWADVAFAHEYLESADHFIPDRAYLFHVLRSYFRRFVFRPERPARICDLGCGDGVLTHQLLAQGLPMTAVLFDGSDDMLAAARKRLGEGPGIRFERRGFDDLIRDPAALGCSDLILSGFAIHHVKRPERQALFRVLLDHLDPGGSFLNVELVLSQSPATTEWHKELWREWIDAQGRRQGVGDKYHATPDQAWANPDNQYSPLEDQLADLRTAGFADVECHYRNGLFAIYGGIRPR